MVFGFSIKPIKFWFIIFISNTFYITFGYFTARIPYEFGFGSGHDFGFFRHSLVEFGFGSGQ